MKRLLVCYLGGCAIAIAIEMPIIFAVDSLGLMSQDNLNGFGMLIGLVLGAVCVFGVLSKWGAA